MQTIYTHKQRSFTYVVFAMWLVSLSGCVGIFGEQIPVTHDALISPPDASSGQVSLTSRAEDRRSDSSRIGRATITVFAITSGNVTTEQPLVEEVRRNVKDALEVAGYKVALTPGDAPGASNPVVTIAIEKFYFRNYNWVWPLVPTWGDVGFQLNVVGTQGNTLYSRSFSGSGTSFCLLGHCAFKAATRRAMTKVLNEIVQACASQEFRAAIGPTT